VEAHQPITVCQGHVVHRGSITTIEPQVGAQLGDICRQAFKGVHIGRAGMAGQQQAVGAHIGADVGAEIAGAQVAAQELHRRPVGLSVVEAGLALLAAGQQPHPQLIDPGDHSTLGGE